MVIVETAGAAPDWVAVRASGSDIRDPVRATNDNVVNLAVPFTLYEVDYIWHNDKLVRTEVHPIRVTRYGVNLAAGATIPSITFTDHNGRPALGSVDNYYLNRSEAELEALTGTPGYTV